MLFCFIFTQEISRTYFRTCLKDHAGIDGQRENLEVHFAVIGGNEFNGDDLMVIFLNFILLQSLQVSFCYVGEHWNNEIRADEITRKIMIVLFAWRHMKGVLISIPFGPMFKENLKYFLSFILIYRYNVAIAACSRCSELNYGTL